MARDLPKLSIVAGEGWVRGAGSSPAAAAGRVRAGAHQQDPRLPRLSQQVRVMCGVKLTALCRMAGSISGSLLSIGKKEKANIRKLVKSGGSRI